MKNKFFLPASTMLASIGFDGNQAIKLMLQMLQMRIAAKRHTYEFKVESWKLKGYAKTKKRQ